MRVTRFWIAADEYLLRLHLWINGARWRIRMRVIRPYYWCKLLTEVFPEGTVHRFWLGPLLFVAMVDDGSWEYSGSLSLT